MWDGRNRRRFPRVVFPCLLKVKKDGNPILTHTENISLGGLCILLKEALAISVLVDVEIDLMDAGDSVQCQGKISWSQQRKSTEAVKPLFYETGVEFINLKDGDFKRLQAIVGHQIKQGKTF